MEGKNFKKEIVSGIFIGEKLMQIWKSSASARRGTFENVEKSHAHWSFSNPSFELTRH